MLDEATWEHGRLLHMPARASKVEPPNVALPPTVITDGKCIVNQDPLPPGHGVVSNIVTCRNLSPTHY